MSLTAERSRRLKCATLGIDRKETQMISVVKISETLKLSNDSGEVVLMTVNTDTKKVNVTTVKGDKEFTFLNSDPARVGRIGLLLVECARQMGAEPKE